MESLPCILVEAFLALKLRPIGQQGKRSQKQQAKFLLVGNSEDATPISTPAFLDYQVLAMGELASYTECCFKAYTGSWRTLSQSCKVLIAT